MNPNVAIIILNWNGWKDTIECLESLYQITYPNYNVILVDNNSEDESIEKIKGYCGGGFSVESKFFKYDPSNKSIKIIRYTREEAEVGGGKEEEISDLPSNRKLIIIKNDKNYGFAEGNNIGIRYALKALNPEYILLLNNDTIVDRNFLGELVKVSESDEKIGIVGAKIYNYYHQNLIEYAGSKINWWLGEVKSIGYKKEDNNRFNKMREVDTVSGCAMLIKKTVIQKIHFLDTNYYLYYEDTDFCIRAKRSGYNIVFCPYSKIWHKSSTSAKKISGVREYYSARNLFIFMKKYSTKNQFYCFLLYFFIFRFWFTIAIIIGYHKEIGAFFSFVKGVVVGLNTTSRTLVLRH